MAFGKVQTIDPSNSQYGTVIEDETGDVYRYDDPNFPNTGLQVDSTCTFDIQYDLRIPIATNLQAYTPTEKIINGPVSGPVTVNSGETLRVVSGGVITGAVTVASNGTLIIEDTGAVNGDVTANDGTLMKVKNKGVITGNVTINSGMALRVVKKGVITGSITVNSANRITIGNLKGGGVINGSLNIAHARHVEITSDSTINCGA